MQSDLPRTLAIIASAIIAIATPIVLYAGDIGLSAAEFSHAGDSTLRAAGYAFSIWGLIYTGLAAYAVYQAVQRDAAQGLLARFGWPSVFAMTGCGLWLIAAAFDWRWATVIIIVLSALSLLSRFTLAPFRARMQDELLIVAPLALLAGWLTIASALNLLTVLTADGRISEAATPFFASFGVAAVAAIALYVFERCRNTFFLAPIVWGLMAVFVAELARSPIVAWIALGAAVVLLLRAGANLATRLAI
jgi:hypothetical protein